MFLIIKRFAAIWSQGPWGFPDFPELPRKLCIVFKQNHSALKKYRLRDEENTRVYIDLKSFGGSYALHLAVMNDTTEHLLNNTFRMSFTILPDY